MHGLSDWGFKGGRAGTKDVAEGEKRELRSFGAWEVLSNEVVKGEVVEWLSVDA